MYWTVFVILVLLVLASCGIINRAQERSITIHETAEEVGQEIVDENADKVEEKIRYRDF